MKKYYMYNDFEFYGTAYPVCIEEKEAKEIWIKELNDRGYTKEEFPFSLLFREATLDEIYDFGIY